MGPRFLCIGATNSGTGWLRNNLAAHPQLWLPPVKELHYLDHVPHRHQWRPIILRDRWSRRRAHRYLAQQIRRLKTLRAPDRAGWALRYFLQPPSARWYGSLFPVRPSMVGECTPDYAFIADDALGLLREMSPDLKVIYLLRNPIHRDWSHAAKILRNRGNKPSIDTAPDPLIFDILRIVDRTGKSNYLDAIEHWSEFFPSDNMFIGFFDELEENPRELLTRILEFLNVDASARILSTSIARRFRSEDHGSIPDLFRTYLCARQYERISKIHAHFNNAYTRKWFDFVDIRKDS